MAITLHQLLENMLSDYSNGNSNVGPIPVANQQAQQVPHYIPQPTIVSPPIVITPGSGGYSAPTRQVIATNQTAIRELHNVEQEEREERRETLAAVMGGLALIAFSGLTAYTLKNFLKNRAELARAREFQQNVLPSLQEGIRQPAIPIVRKYIEVLEVKHLKSRNIIIITAGLLGCATSAFIGGMFSMPFLITASIVTGVGTAAFGVFHIVWHWDDETSLPQNMRTHIQQLLTQLPQDI